MTGNKTALKERTPYQELDIVLQKYKGRQGVLIKALQEAQSIFGYLPRKVQIHIARQLDVPLSEVYSVVSFYSLFSTEPVGSRHLEICTGTACYIKGAKQLLKKLEDDLSLTPGKVTKDKKYSLAETRCVGICSAAPVIKMGKESYGHVSPKKLASILEEQNDLQDND